MDYSTAIKNDRLQVVADAVDAGAGAGKLVIGTAGMATVLAVVILSDPAFDPPSGGVMNMAGLPRSDLSADASGTPAAAIITDSDDNICVSSLTVGTSGTDIIISSADINAGDEFRLETATIVHA